MTAKKKPESKRASAIGTGTAMISYEPSSDDHALNGQKSYPAVILSDDEDSYTVKVFTETVDQIRKIAK